MLVRFLVVFLAVFAVAGVAHAAPPAGDNVAIGARPAWVEAAPDARPAAGAPRADELGDVYDEIADEQLHVRAPGSTGLAARMFTTARYVRRRRHIVTSAGVERASELRFSFDPSYERLVFHSLRVIRDGIARDALELARIRVFSEESSADERIYDGTMTALAVVPDVRPGDIIDSEVTTEGENPVFDGHFSDTFTLGTHVWTGWLRVRVLLPTTRPVETKIPGSTLQVTKRELGTESELVVTRENVAATKDEHDAPSWFSRAPVLHVSEYRSWGDVAAWAAPLFDDGAGREPAVAAKAAELRAAHPTPEARALAAIRFVQDDVRYLGIEIGEHSHRPHTSGSVLAQRFGDCKDKSLLLVALLRGLELEADVALVNTRLEEHVVEQLPSHGAFNHAVVRLRSGGQSYWIDATASLEGGMLERYTTLPYGRALVVARGTRELTQLPPEKLTAPTTITREHYRPTGGPASEGATLDVETTFFGEEADGMRQRVARSPRADIATRYLNYYAGFEPSIRPSGELVVTDDRPANIVVVKERYEIPELFRDGFVRLHAATVSGPLDSPKTSLRATPLGVTFPYWGRHEIELELPAKPRHVPEDTSRSSGAFTFERKVTVEGRVMRFQFEVRTRSDSVRVEDVAAHLRNLDEVRDLIHPSVKLGGGESPLNWTAIGWSAGGVLGVAGLLVGYAYVPSWWRRRRFRKGQAFGRGDTAKTARAVKSRAEAERDVLSRKCACRLPVVGPLPGSAWSTIALGETTVTVARAECVCGGAVRRYYVVPET